jgi:WXXGXW repeat (2 copies)
MEKKVARLFLPVLLAVFVCGPAFAQMKEGGEHRAPEAHHFQTAPPRSRTEKRSARPSRNHTWIGGYWEPQHEQWAWAPGRWEEPTMRGAHWVKPRYHHERDGYRYEAGHWSH